MKKILSIIMALAMLVSITAMFASCGSNEEASTGAETNADGTEKETFVIGITYFEPMNYFNDNNELVGFETEFAKAVCAKLGLEPKFQEIDWKVKETELNSGAIDCIWNGMTIDDDRKANMGISDPYMENKQVLVVKKDNLEKFSDPANLADAYIVAEEGSAGETVATENSYFADSNFTAVATQANALMEVKSGTADAAIVDFVLSIGSIGEGTDYSDFVVVDAYDFNPEEYGIAFRKGDTETREKFQKAIDELMADGTIDKIAEKYKLKDLLIK
ncbi:MAG: transporter substrate-binding domain-containing protein [Clostridia bacterium]|nr:transporter substrate-binding domain-containing protein [Clostridia bacterium]